MKEKTISKELFDDEIKVLKKQGLWFKQNFMNRSSTVFIIACIATLVDGLTIYYTLNPILKGNMIMNLLLTITASAILDIFPSYWVDSIEKIRNHKDFTVKLFLIISVMAWMFVFICLCVVRIHGWQFVLQSTLQEQYSNQESNVDMFIPVLDKTLGIIIMLFLCFVNFATSAAVLLATAITHTPEEIMKSRQKFSIKTLLNQLSLKKDTEKQQLEDVIASDFEAYENAKHDGFKAEAEAEANRQRKIAVEDLARELSDSDVSTKLLGNTKSEGE
uniref:hypothetical protein n=1 Tax=Eubacterium sp. TaxID=142586 RepID=UPI003FEF83A6